MSRFLPYWTMALLFFPFAPMNAFAHGLGVDCRVRGRVVEVEAFYDDGTDAVKAKVKVVNDKEEEIAAGVTDDKGKWSFPAPKAGKYVVHVDAGAGHRAKKEIEVTTEGATPEETKPAAEPTITSSGPTREEFTQTPWLKLAIGLTVIGGCCGAFVIATRLRKTNPRE